MHSDRKWPDHYGVVGDYVPVGFVKQQLFPFIGSTEAKDVAESGDAHTNAGKKARASMVPAVREESGASGVGEK